MASVARPGAIDLMEQALHALRAAPFSTLVCQWTGTVPFFLGLLIFWASMTRTGALDSTCALEAALLAVLFVWMNCWRAVFAERMMRQLGLRPAVSWRATRVIRLVLHQASMGGARLFIWPMAVAVMLPLPFTIAFYRSALALAGSDLEGGRLIAKARKLAGYDQRQGWAILVVLSILFLILSANIGILLIFLPQLIRMLTGVESVFSRSGTLLLSSGLFWLSTLVVSWLLFDPFAQAVYCVRCFHLESRESGEDLRASLRRIAAVAVLVLLIVPAVARGQVRPENLGQSIRQTLQSPDYDWRNAPSARSHGAGVPWLVAFTDRMVDSLRSGTRAVSDAIARLLDWLLSKMKPPRLDNSAPPERALHWSIYVLIAALLVLAGVMVWRFRRPRRVPSLPNTGGIGVVNLNDENLSASQLPEDRWVALAEECLLRQDFRSALRALYLANLAWLGSCEWIAIHPGKTNREYQVELRRKARAFPGMLPLFGEAVVDFERAWYGMHTVSAEDADRFRLRIQSMKAAAA
ncbi:MAG: DUF4129 domain-containing protein [Bryobacteraceae bacterium]